MQAATYRPVTAKTSRVDTIMNKVHKSHSRILSYSSMKSTDANSKTIEQPESNQDQLSSPRNIMQTAFTPRDNRSINQLERYGTVGTAEDTGA